MLKLVVLSAVLAVVAAKPGAVIAPYAAYSAVVVPATTTITRQASSVIHPSPAVYSSPFVYSHFIKKRSPQFLSYNYAPRTYVSNLPYATAPLLTTPVVHRSAVLPAGFAYSTAHLIKKRSASVFFAPTSYATPIIPSTYAAPVISTPVVHSTPLISAPVTYSTHFIKKRSTPLLSTYLAPTSYSHQSRVDVINHAPVLKVAPYTAHLTFPYYY